jgi:hypothetical protein
MISEHSRMQMHPIDIALYEWKDHSRFVEVTPVQTGWLIVWGHYEDLGSIKRIHGARVYRDLTGVRRRLADIVTDFTKKPQEAVDALMEFERLNLPTHTPAPLKTVDS